VNEEIFFGLPCNSASIRQLILLSAYWQGDMKVSMPRQSKLQKECYIFSLYACLDWKSSRWRSTTLESTRVKVSTSMGDSLPTAMSSSDKVISLIDQNTQPPAHWTTFSNRNKLLSIFYSTLIILTIFRNRAKFSSINLTFDYFRGWK